MELFAGGELEATKEVVFKPTYELPIYNCGGIAFYKHFVELRA